MGIWTYLKVCSSFPILICVGPSLHSSAFLLFGLHYCCRLLPGILQPSAAAIHANPNPLCSYISSLTVVAPLTRRDSLVGTCDFVGSSLPLLESEQRPFIDPEVINLTSAGF